MRRFTKRVFVAVVILTVGVLVKASITQPPTGGWLSAGAMIEKRNNAASALLPDGRILISGGDNGSGPVASAEFFDTTGRFVAAPPMSTPRSAHSATVLADGRILVAGGSIGAAATNAAEIFDPALNSWTAVAGGMVQARSNHTASLLADGRVLFAGGDNAGTPTASLEIFDPVAGSFSSVAVLSSPRTSFASAVLSDGRVLLIGGSNGSAPVSSTEIFDPLANLVSAGPALSTPRMSHSATTLLDGRVLVVGGTNLVSNADGSSTPTDLASAEIYDPSTGAFSVSAASLAAARRDHTAFLLPNNNSVLIVGGTSSGNEIGTAEMFVPSTGTFAPTGSPAAARQHATGTALKQDGILFLAGGSNSTGTLASAELYGFATVKTDAQDYAPGSVVTITGSGWQLGETVTLTLVESPLVDTHPVMTAVADAQGNIFNNQFSPDLHDINIRFYLTAAGSSSQAQTTFTDANLIGATVTMEDATCTSSQTTFQLLDTACASVAVTTGGGGTAPDLHIEWFNPSNTLVRDTTKSSVANGSTQTDTLPLSGGNAVLGTWTVKSCKNSGCSGGNLVDTKTFTVTKASQTITVTTHAPASAAYNSTFPVAATGGASGNPVVITTTGGCSISGGTVTMTSSTVTCVVHYNQAGNATYNAAPEVTESTSAQKADQTITFTGAPANAGYNSTFAVTASASSGLAVTLGASGACSISGTTVTMTSGTGTCSLTADQPGDGNYNAAPQATQSTTAQKATSTTTVTGGSFVYNGNPHPATVLVTGTGGLSLTPAPTYSGGCVAAPVNVSETTPTACTASYSYAGDANHLGSDGSATISITKASTTTLIISDGPDPSLVGAAYTVTFSVSVTAPGAGTPVGTVNVSDGSGGTCTATLPANSCLVTSTTVGAKNLTASYSGGANFTGSVSATAPHNVQYNFVGFLQPIDNLPILNSATGGQTIPVKWQLQDAAGGSVSSLATFTSLQAAPVGCLAAPVSIIDDYVTATGGTILRYDAGSNQFIYNWQTAKSMSGCWQLRLTLSDGTYHDAFFQFR